MGTTNFSFLKKLRDYKGESIAETLVALLISALALTMLAMAITSASNIIRTSRDTISSYYKGNEALVTMSGTLPTGVTSGNGTVIIEDKTSGIAPISNQSISVNYYENTLFGDDNKVINYRKP